MRIDPNTTSVCFFLVTFIVSQIHLLASWGQEKITIQDLGERFPGVKNRVEKYAYLVFAISSIWALLFISLWNLDIDKRILIIFIFTPIHYTILDCGFTLRTGVSIHFLNYNPRIFFCEEANHRWVRYLQLGLDAILTLAWIFLMIRYPY